MNKKHKLISALCLAILAISPAWADRDHDHEREHGRGHGKHGHDDESRRDYDDRDGGLSINIRFGDSHRSAVNDYYGHDSGRNHCPPGLAKKGNGCQAPGQARKWQMGRALPRDLSYYPLPNDLLRRMPPAPRGHEYVRVAGDILLITVGTRMVVDAIEDLVR